MLQAYERMFVVVKSSTAILGVIASPDSALHQTGEVFTIAPEQEQRE